MLNINLLHVHYRNKSDSQSAAPTYSFIIESCWIIAASTPNTRPHDKKSMVIIMIVLISTIH